jgi:hypothetical protein
MLLKSSESAASFNSRWRKMARTDRNPNGIYGLVLQVGLMEIAAVLIIIVVVFAIGVAFPSNHDIPYLR